MSAHPLPHRTALPASTRPEGCAHWPARRQWLSRSAALALASSPALSPLQAAAQAIELPDVVAASKPSVVAIGLYDPLANPRFQFRGTGFVVGDGRTVVTNAHVLPPPGDKPDVQLAMFIPGERRANLVDGQARVLKLKTLDREHDLAVLTAPGDPLPTLKLAASDTAREGQAIALIGFPLGSVLGFSHITHTGIVSSITPIVLPPANSGQLDAAAVARMRKGVFNILQLDATAYPGNSGGPLLDARTGEVLGVVNMVVVKKTRESALSDPSGISYAVPVSFLHTLLDGR